MRISAACAVLLLMGTPGWADYTFYQTDSLTTINGTNWSSNGSVAASPGGLTGPGAGGSLISKATAPNDANSYEVRATVTLTASGGNYALYARASSDASMAGSGSGSFVALQMENPVFDGNGNCAANFVLYQRLSGSTTITALTSFAHACRNGMMLRLIVRPQFTMMYVDSWLPTVYGDAGIATGQPGIGATATPTGNAISLVKLGPLDTVPPGTINPQSVGSSLFSNEIDLQWQGVTDDANGIGFFTYQIFRNGTVMGASTTPVYSDETVSPGVSYVYTIYAIDQHNNYSAATSLTLAAAPSGSTDPREFGVRPTGSYWGAAGEQIDLRSGNLNFTLPLISAQSRGGWSVGFALSYNSQVWRQDSGGTWNYGRNVGYGFGWKLQAGSLTPVYAGWWNYVSHCTSL